MSLPTLHRIGPSVPATLMVAGLLATAVAATLLLAVEPAPPAGPAEPAPAAHVRPAAVPAFVPPTPAMLEPLGVRPPADALRSDGGVPSAPRAPGVPAPR